MERQNLLMTLQGWIERPETLSQQAFRELRFDKSDPENRRWAGELESALQMEWSGWVEKVWAETDKLLSSAVSALGEGRPAEDFDGFIVQLEEWRTQFRRTLSDEVLDNTNFPAYDRLEEISRWLQKWQEYLVAKEAGDRQAAFSILEEWGEIGSWSTFMPGTEMARILNTTTNAAHRTDATPAWAREASPAEIEERAEAILADVKELEGLGPALKKLRELRADTLGAPVNSAAKQLLSPLISQLQVLDKNYQDYKFGLPADMVLRPPAFNNGDSTDVFAAHLARLRSAYLTLMLARFIGLPEEARPEPDEDLAGFVKKAALSQGEKADPRFLLRCQEAMSILRGSDQVDEETAGVRAYLAGYNLEIAGQSERAATAYREALESGNELLPAEAIGKRLQALSSSIRPASGKTTVGGKEEKPQPRLPRLLLIGAVAGALWMLLGKRK